MAWCAAFGCNNNWKNCKGKNISFYSLPKEENIRKQWITALPRTELPKQVHVCSEHFEESCFDSSVKLQNELLGCEKPLKLILGSVPTKFSHKSATALRTSSSKESKTNHNIEEEMRMKGMRWAVRLFKEYLKENNEDDNFESFSTDKLDTSLTGFYVSLRQKEGKIYSISSYIKIRTGINRFLMSPPNNRMINIIYDREYMVANQVLRAIIRKLRKSRYDITKHTLVILDKDMRKLYSSGVLSNDTPLQLLRKVFIEISIHFGVRCRKKLNELTKKSIIVRQDGKGREYATMGRKKIIYAQPNSTLCPVFSLKKYLSKLNEKCTAFFQRPLKINNPECVRCWYENKSLGIKKIAAMMKIISQEAQLSKIYTNNCIRATNAAYNHVEIKTEDKCSDSERSDPRRDDESNLKYFNAESNADEYSLEKKSALSYQFEIENSIKVELLHSNQTKVRIDQIQNNASQHDTEFDESTTDSERSNPGTEDESNLLYFNAESSADEYSSENLSDPSYQFEFKNSIKVEIPDSNETIESIGKIQNDASQLDMEFDEMTTDSERSDPRRDDESSLEYFNAESMADEYTSQKNSEFENFIKVEIPDSIQTTEGIDKIQNDALPHDTEFDECSTDWNTFLQISDVRSINYI